MGKPDARSEQFLAENGSTTEPFPVIYSMFFKITRSGSMGIMAELSFDSGGWCKKLHARCARFATSAQLCHRDHKSGCDEVRVRRAISPDERQR